MVEMLRTVVGVPGRGAHAGKSGRTTRSREQPPRPGLALAGYVDLFTHKRVQVLGNTECQYLEHLTEDQADDRRSDT
jgi:HPr kinase/phosphorylase